MSKSSAHPPLRPARQSFHNRLLQSASWLGWEMPSPEAVQPPLPSEAASTPAPKTGSVTPPLVLPAGSEPA
jgi:hypothetical protein